MTCSSSCSMSMAYQVGSMPKPKRLLPKPFLYGKPVDVFVSWLLPLCLSLSVGALLLVVPTRPALGTRIRIRTLHCAPQPRSAVRDSPALVAGVTKSCACHEKRNHLLILYSSLSLITYPFLTRGAKFPWRVSVIPKYVPKPLRSLTLAP